MLPIIFIPSGRSLETFYEDTLEYLYDKHHPRTPENTNYRMSE
jgi:hypothetical protein